jgi:carbon-monoxide dehydrogenase medium subunit
MLALNATVVTNKRKIPADKFFKGLFETALSKSEFILQVLFPMPKRAAYAKFPNPASRFAMVGVFVADHGKDVRVAVAGASEDGVFRAKDMEGALKKSSRPLRSTPSRYRARESCPTSMPTVSNARIS